MPDKGRNDAGPSSSEDRELWRRIQDVEAPHDEAERFDDLAAFADGRLDDDDNARVAALIARDTAAADDVAAARALAGTAALPASGRVIDRAVALAEGASPGAAVIAFPLARAAAPRPWFDAACWGGLAAAVVLAGWLGFNIGSGFNRTEMTARSAEDLSASEFFDLTPVLSRDFTENPRI